MATLADELAADLDFSSDEEEQQRSDIDEEQEALDKMKQEESEDDRMEDATESTSSSDENPNSDKKIAKLLYNKQTQEVLKVNDALDRY
jgi:U4/U6 small nuclear ribonucleoprotein PRP31